MVLVVGDFAALDSGWAGPGPFRASGCHRGSEVIAGVLVFLALSAWAVAAWALFSRELMRETALGAVAAAYKREKNAIRRLTVYERDHHDHLWRVRSHLREAVAAEFASRIDKAIAMVSDAEVRVYVDTFEPSLYTAQTSTLLADEAMIVASFPKRKIAAGVRVPHYHKASAPSRRLNVSNELGFRLGQAYSQRIMALLEELEKAPNRGPGTTYPGSRS